MKFEKGNVVTHKGGGITGGPRMVICSVESEGMCICSWYSKTNDKFNIERFEAEELELAAKV